MQSLLPLPCYCILPSKYWLCIPAHAVVKNTVVHDAAACSHLRQFTLLLLCCQSHETMGTSILELVAVCNATIYHGPQLQLQLLLQRAAVQKCCPTSL